MDIWNCLDVGRTAFSAVYIFSTVAGSKRDDEGYNVVAAFAIMLTWFRMLDFFRVYYQTRYLIRMIIEIFKGMFSFLIIFLFVVLVFSLGLMALRGDEFVEIWQASYQSSFGDFEDDYQTHSERTIFFLASVFLPLVMLNLLIAIMGDIHDKVQEEQAVADVKEKLDLILEIGRLIFWHRNRMPEIGYLHLCKATIAEEEISWEGRVRAIKMSVNKVKSKVDDLSIKMDKISTENTQCVTEI